jgi:hypothetical protein
VSDYQDAFYKQYEAEFIKDPSVRKAHDWIFSIADKNWDFRDVLDLGCGEAQEFRRFGPAGRYCGVDSTAKAANVRLDYRRMDWRAWPVCATAFVSLFSVEITSTPSANYRLYEQLFTHKNIGSGLVSGFYYTDRKNENPVKEVGGVTSFQTLESVEDVVSPVFTETRIVLPVPSAMFGPNVVEVWKFLRRR